MKKKRQEIVKIERVPGIPFVRVVTGHAVVNDFSRHIHSGLCVGIVTSGVRRMTVGEDSAELHEGDGFIVGGGQPHSCCAADGQAHSYTVFVIDAGSIAELDFSDLAFRSFICGDAELSRRMKELAGVLLSDESLIEKESALYSFIEMLMRSFASGTGPDSRPVPEAVARVREYIDERCTEQLSLEEIASVAGISPFHLNRLFCAEVGMAPHSYQMHRRIERSKHRLREHHSIADTALEMGFADQSHFSKFFKRIVGTTPANFVKWNP